MPLIDHDTCSGSLIRRLPVPVVGIDRAGQVRWANAAAALLLGRDEGALERQLFAGLLAGSCSEPVTAMLDTAFAGRLASHTLALALPDGTVRQVSADAVAVECDAGWLAVVTLRASNEPPPMLALAAKVIENTPEAVVVTDAERRIVAVNPSFVLTTGYSAEEVIGRDPSILSSGRHGPDFYRAMWQSLAETGQWRGEIWNRRKNGDIYPEWLNINAIRDEAGRLTHYSAIFSDLSAHEDVRQRLHRLAYYDLVTDLPNRDLFRDRLANAIARARRDTRRVGVLYLDLDRFKTVNDSLGHPTGDTLLKRVADRLRQVVRHSDTVARLGGDEFVAVFADLREPQDAVEAAQKIYEVLREPFVIGGHELFVGVSIGISIFPNDGSDVDELLGNADAAMYRAKELGRNNFQFYTAALGARSADRLLLENELRKSIERRELSLLFQPQIDLAGGQIVGVEALARWDNGRLGPVRPDVFIPIAEETGFIGELGRWVLDEALASLRRWHDAGFTQLKLAVNVSGHQIASGTLVDDVRLLLNRHRIVPTQLELELTESVLMDNAKATMALLADLHAFGITLAVDDFGTGYSSLAYLKRFEIDKLKIDKSFVSDIPRNPNDAAIAATIIAMGHKLGLKVVAEGVETPEQLRFLADQGCDQIQGYLFSRPIDSETLLELLKDGEAWHATLQQHVFEA